MDKKKIDKLIKISYKNIDEEKVEEIGPLLSKADLKRYIQRLKSAENENNLIISSPIDNQYEKRFQKLFPNRKIVFIKDPSLILGVKIVDNDKIYDFTLKDSFEKIINYIEQNYD
jgi:hypothetical protein